MKPGWLVLILAGLLVLDSPLPALLHIPQAVAPLPAISVAAYSTTHGRQAVELPGLEGPQQSGSGTLGTTYRVDWRRTGNRYTIQATRTGSGDHWRLAVEARYPSDTRELTLWDQSLPVTVPLQSIRGKGQSYWTWTIGAPVRLASSAPRGGSLITPETGTHHGFWISGEKDSTFVAQFGLDAWTTGSSAILSFTVTPAVAPAAPPKAAVAGRSRLTGFLRVDRQGEGFVDGSGRTWRMMGRNQHDFVAMDPNRQEALLAGMVQNGMNTLRILVQDTLFQPLPGQWNAEAVRRLRPALDRCAAHGIRVIICLELSGCGYQYSVTQHSSPCWSDLYLLPSTRAIYRDRVRRIVAPLRDHAAIAAWDVTNEPDLPPDPTSLVQAEEFRRYTTRLRGPSAPALLPTVPEYEAQATECSRDYWRWASGALAESLIDRARAIRQADPNHMITLSAWDPRMLRGYQGADLFSYWSPHTYDLWINGPLIEKHVAGLVLAQRTALPGRPRPVVIEEFGLSEDPSRPEAMRAEHIRQFAAAARRWGAGGLLHWWDMTPSMLEAYRSIAPGSRHPVGKPLAVWLPPSNYPSTVIYSRYMERRGWEAAIWKAIEAGYTPTFVYTPEQARAMGRLMTLGQPMTQDESRFAGKSGVPGYQP